MKTQLWFPSQWPTSTPPHGLTRGTCTGEYACVRVCVRGSRSVAGADGHDHCSPALCQVAAVNDALRSFFSFPTLLPSRRTCSCAAGQEGGYASAPMSELRQLQEGSRSRRSGARTQHTQSPSLGREGGGKGSRSLIARVRCMADTVRTAFARERKRKRIRGREAASAFGEEEVEQLEERVPAARRPMDGRGENEGEEGGKTGPSATRRTTEANAHTAGDTHTHTITHSSTRCAGTMEKRERRSKPHTQTHVEERDRTCITQSRGVEKIKQL